MEAHDRGFEVERFVDIALSTMDVDILPLHYTFIDPAITNWLDLNLSLCVRFEAVDHPPAIYRILEDVKTVSVLDVGSTIVDNPSMAADLDSQIHQLDFLLL